MSEKGGKLRVRDLVKGGSDEAAGAAPRPDRPARGAAEEGGRPLAALPQVVVETGGGEESSGPALPFDVGVLLVGLWRRRLAMAAVFALVVVFALAAAVLSRERTWRVWSTVLRKSEQKEYLVTGTQPIVKLQIYSMPTLLRLVKVTENLEAALAAAAVDGVGATALSQRITVDNPRDTQLIEIVLEWEDRDEAVALVNALALVFIDRVDLLQKMEAIEAAEYLGRQLEETRQRLATLEEEVVTFRRDHEVVKLDEQTGRLLQQIAEFDALAAKERLDGEMARIAVERTEAELRTQASTVVASTYVKKPVHGRMVELEAELAGALSVYTDDSPKVLELKDELARVRDLLRRGLEEDLQEQTVSRNPVVQNLEQTLVDRRVEAASRAARAEGYAKVLEGLRGRLLELPELESRFADITQRLDTLRELESILASRVEEARIIRDSTAPNLSIMQAARAPDAPLPSGARLVAAAGVVLGLGLALLAGVALELRDTSLKAAREAEPVLGVAALGEVPRLPGEQVLLAELDEGPTAEVYRQLLTRLLQEPRGGRGRLLLVTAAGHFEGRTTVASNLARVAAARGLKTTLVDADLRKPNLGDLALALGVELAPGGLAGVLAGELELEAALTRTAWPRLTWLAAGRRAAPELLAGEELPAVLEALCASHDLVVLDAAPVLAGADALLVAPRADGVVLVIEAGGLPRAALREAVARLQGSGATLAGTVLNKVDPAYGERFGPHRLAVSPPEAHREG